MMCFSKVTVLRHFLIFIKLRQIKRSDLWEWAIKQRLIFNRQQDRCVFSAVELADTKQSAGHVCVRECGFSWFSSLQEKTNQCLEKTGNGFQLSGISSSLRCSWGFSHGLKQVGQRNRIKPWERRISVELWKPKGKNNSWAFVQPWL